MWAELKDRQRPCGFQRVLMQYQLGFNSEFTLWYPWLYPNFSLLISCKKVVQNLLPACPLPCLFTLKSQDSQFGSQDSGCSSMESVSVLYAVLGKSLFSTHFRTIIYLSWHVGWFGLKFEKRLAWARLKSHFTGICLWLQVVSTGRSLYWVHFLF